ncbi:MAG: 50S ribosomal protein L6 [Gammaproteobacteria bacterium]|nr:50S ribosomal protein L6 [Gammaproteobacteria bacterium]
MSRIANTPISLPSGVEVKIDGRGLSVKGSKGTLELTLHDGVEVEQGDNVLKFSASNKEAVAMSGTTRALVNNMVVGVTDGYEKRLLLNGVGYRVAVSGNKLNLTLGFSHPVIYELPEGVSVETPSQTEIVVRGIDKQAVGQAAAEIRAFRPPEPYKAKGVRYADETVRRKDAKKK